MTPRGIANNNPGNLRRSDEAWLGEATRQTDPEFVVFETPEYGLRALAKTLLSYQDVHGLRTLSEIIARWAPPGENDTGAYAADVAARCGLVAGQPIDLHDPKLMTLLVVAIVRHENGVQPYPPKVVATALELVGLTPA